MSSVGTFWLAGVMFCFSPLEHKNHVGAFENENPICTQWESLEVGPRNHMQVHLVE